jgi:hypothetical protein
VTIPASHAGAHERPLIGCLLYCFWVRAWRGSVLAPGLSLSFRLPTLVVWLSFGLRGPGVVLGPGEAREGFVALEAALPSRLDSP